jgi:CheY-like chemotaxis protein
MSRTRVLLADDHAATVQRWRLLLEPEFEVVATVSDGQALVEADERLRPDVIVTDIVMPGMNGIVATELILRKHPAARVVFATVHADRTATRVGGWRVRVRPEGEGGRGPRSGDSGRAARGTADQPLPVTPRDRTLELKGGGISEEIENVRAEPRK